MKKLVTVFALCAAMSAVAQVESSNIVGYSTRVLDNASGIIDATNPFINLQSAQGDWVVTNNNFMGQTLVDGDIFLLLNMDYLAFDTYTWVAPNNRWELTDSEGLYTDEPVASITIKKGDTFYAIFADSKVVTSGQVAASGPQNVVFAKDNPLYVNGLFPFANPFPVNCTFGDITGKVDGDIILLLNMDYLAFDTYTWVAPNSRWELTDSEGLFTDSPVPGSTLLLKAGGAGFFVPAWQTANVDEVRTVTFTINY